MIAGNAESDTKKYILNIKLEEVKMFEFEWISLSNLQITKSPNQHDPVR